MPYVRARVVSSTATGTAYLLFTLGKSRKVKMNMGT